MHNHQERLPFRAAVIVADLIDEDDQDTPVHLRRDLERTDRATLDAICKVIVKNGFGVYHYETPKELAENAKKHRDDVVLSIFGGVESRSRMALVPAICETFGLCYIGPDAYARMMCQNKEVSKAVASHVGLTIASHRIVRTEKDIEYALGCQYPAVAKPLWEGSSIGISAQNLITNRLDGERVLRFLLEHLKQPIMLETFVPGQEVSWCFIDGKSPVRSLVEVVWDGDPTHFHNRLYDADHKMSGVVAEYRIVTQELTRETEDSLERLIFSLGPLGYGRIDGKLSNETFVFIEATPDAWLGPNGTFMSSWVGSFTFEEAILRILRSSLQTRPSLLPNG